MGRGREKSRERERMVGPSGNETRGASRKKGTNEQRNEQRNERGTNGQESG